MIHQIVFYLLLVFLPTQLGLHYWPAWAMVLGRRVDYLSPTLYLTDIAIFLIIFFWFLSFFTGIKNYESRIKNFHGYFLKTINHYSLFIIPFVVFVAVNIYFATNPMEAIYKWAKVLEYMFLGLYIVRTRPKLSSTVFFLSIGILYSSVIAIAQFLLQHSVGGPLWWLGERTFSNLTPGIAQFNFCWTPLKCQLILRAYGTFPHPNVLGGCIAVMMPLIVNQLSKGKKIFYAAVLATGIIALVLTFSRGAWIVAIVGIAYWAARARQKIMIPLLLVSVLAVLVILLSFGIGDESVAVRSQLNSAAMTQFFRSPFIGVGLGNFLVELPRTLVSRQIYFLQPVHNIYLLLLSEIGIVGVGFIIFLSYIFLKHELRIMNYGKYDKNTPIIHCALFIILILGLVDHYPLTLQQGQLLFTILLAASTIAS